MHTRSSPSLSVLHSLARTARLDTASLRRLSKPLLFQRLKESTNFDRLRRVQARSIKRQQQKQREEEGEQETRTARSHASSIISSSTSSSTSSSSRRKRNSIVRSQHHTNGKEEEEGRIEKSEMAAADFVKASSNSSNSSNSSSDRSKGDAVQADLSPSSSSPSSSSSAFFSSSSFSYPSKPNMDTNDNSGGGKMSSAEEAAWEALSASLASSLPPSRPRSVDPILLTELNSSSFPSSLPFFPSSTSSSSAAAASTTATTAVAAGAVAGGNGGKDDGLIFRFLRPNGSTVSYRVASLIDYLLATGKFEEPETRLPFTDTDLETLDRLGREGGLDRRSVWRAKHYDGEKYTEMRFRRDALMGLERFAGELVTEMLQLVEEEEDAEEGEMRLVLTLFPLLSDLYRQMEEGGREGGDDGEWARQCLGHWQDFMRGPPNRRTRDRFGFLGIVLAFFADLQRGGRGGF
ncbi:hypothetical protein VYU27_004442 [Nannochloropsis oceanica]